MMRVEYIYIYIASKISGQHFFLAWAYGVTSIPVLPQDNGHLVTKQIGPGAVPLDSSPIGGKMRH